MNAILISVVGIIAVAILIYMLLKKNDIKMTLLGLGIVLMYIAILVGNKIKVSTPTGTALLDPFQAVVDQFSNTLVGPGFVILILGGYSAYMSHIGANQVTVHALTKPIAKIRSVYILIAIILLATLYPVLRAAGMSRLSAAAVIGTSAKIVPTPLGSDNVAIAAQLHMTVTDYVFKSHALVSIPTLLAIAIVHYLWQKHEDKRQPETLTYADELTQNSDGKAGEAVEDVTHHGFMAFIYGLLPLLPIVLLLVIFFLNLVIGTKLNMSVQMVTLISFVVAVFVELLAKRKAQAVLKETGTFFTGMGDVMSIVALLVAAQTFVQGLTSLGIINLIQNAMQNMSGSGIVLPIIMVLFTAVIVLLSGSGTALVFAMIPLIIPLSKAAGIDPVALSIPMQLAGNLLRAVSPVAAVVLIVAGTTKLSPIQIVKRTSVPMIFGVVMMLVMSLILF